MKKAPSDAHSYSCVAGKCDHAKGSAACWTFRLATAMDSIGNPALLDDTELLSAFLTIPTNPKVDMSSFSSSRGKIPDPINVFNTLGLFLVQTTEVPDMDVYRAVVLLVYSSIGVSLCDDTSAMSKGLIVATQDTVDYGNAYNTAAASARINWLNSCGPASKGVDASRARAVLSVMMSMIMRGMETWALELFTFLSEEHAAMRFLKSIPDPKEAKLYLSDTKKGATLFAKCIGLLCPYIGYLADSVSASASASASSGFYSSQQNKKTHVSSSSSEEDIKDFCNCGLSWLRIAEYSSIMSDGNNNEETENQVPVKMYMVCPLDVLISKGCGKCIENTFD